MAFILVAGEFAGGSKVGIKGAEKLGSHLDDFAEITAKHGEEATEVFIKNLDVDDLGKITGYKPKDGLDLDFRNTGKTYKDALEEAFKRTGKDKSDFEVTKWGKNADGKSFPVEWRTKNNAEVNIDIGHTKKGPDVPHIGYQTEGKRKLGGAVRGHIFVDDVPFNRPTR